MKIVHKQITYVIENVEEIEKIIREQPEEWEAHNRSDVTKNYKGELQVEIYYRLRELQQHNVVGSGDIRIVNLPVQVLFEWSDKIVADYDSKTDTVLEYTSGYVMKVMPNQQFVHKGEETIFIAQAMIERS